VVASDIFWPYPYTTSSNPTHCLVACSSHPYCAQYATHFGKSHSVACPVLSSIVMITILELSYLIMRTPSITQNKILNKTTSYSSLYCLKV
jgi:hypothetical protein